MASHNVIFLFGNGVHAATNATFDPETREIMIPSEEGEEPKFELRLQEPRVYNVPGHLRKLFDILLVDGFTPFHNELGEEILITGWFYDVLLGWMVVDTKNYGHRKLYSPSGEIVFDLSGLGSTTVFNFSSPMLSLKAGMYKTHID